MEQSDRVKHWIETGYDRVSGVNPPPNSPEPLPPHQHSDGFHPDCGLCQQLREKAREQSL